MATVPNDLFSPALLIPGLHHPEPNLLNHTMAKANIEQGNISTNAWLCGLPARERRYTVLGGNRPDKKRDHFVDYYGGSTSVLHLCVGDEGDLGGWPGPYVAELDPVLYIHRAGDEALGDADVNVVDPVTKLPSTVSALFSGQGVLPWYHVRNTTLVTRVEDGALKPVQSEIGVTLNLGEPLLCETRPIALFWPVRQYEMSQLDAPGSMPLDLVADLAGLIRTAFLITPDGTPTHESVEVVLYLHSVHRSDDSSRPRAVDSRAFLRQRGAALGWLLRRLKGPFHWRVFASGNAFVRTTCFAKVIFPLSGYNRNSKAPIAAGGGEAHPEGEGWASLRSSLGLREEDWERRHMVTSRRIFDPALATLIAKLTNHSVTTAAPAFVGHVKRVVKADGTVEEQQLRDALSPDRLIALQQHHASSAELTVQTVVVRVGVLQPPSIPSELFAESGRFLRWDAIADLVARTRAIGATETEERSLRPISSLRRRVVTPTAFTNLNQERQRRVIDFQIEVVVVDPNADRPSSDFSKRWAANRAPDPRGPATTPDRVAPSLINPAHAPHDLPKSLLKLGSKRLQRLDRMAQFVRELDILVMESWAADLYAGWAAVLPPRSVVIEVGVTAVESDCGNATQFIFSQRQTKPNGRQALPFAFRATADASAHLKLGHLHLTYRACTKATTWSMTDAAFHRLLWQSSCARLQRLTQVSAEAYYSPRWEWPENRKEYPAIRSDELPDVCREAFVN